MDHATWQAGGRFLAFGPHRVFVREVGEGPPIVFLHGFPTSSFDFADVMDGLKAHHRCITFDFLGFGASSKPFPYRYTYDEQLAITLAVLRDAKVTSAVIVAHDYAVSVAQELLARAAEGPLGIDMRAVVFLNGGVCARLHRPIPVQRLLASGVGAHLGKLLVRRASFERSLSGLVGSHPPPKSFFDAAWKGVSASDGTRVVPLLLHYIAERRLRSARWESALRDTRVPLTFVWGMADTVSGRHMLEWVRAEIPRAKTTALETIGHYPQTTATAEVIAEIREAIGGLASS